MKGDAEGEWTYHGARRDSVIGYVVVNEEANERIVDFKAEKRIEDHQLWTEHGVKEHQEKMR